MTVLGAFALMMAGGLIMLVGVILGAAIATPKD